MRWMLFPVGVLTLLATLVDLFATVAQPGHQGGFLATRPVDHMGGRRSPIPTPEHPSDVAALLPGLVSGGRCSVERGK